MLRGPFTTPTYGPGPGWQWDYQTWQVAGPLLSCLATLVGLPGWHASRSARVCQCQGSWYEMAGWIIACFVFLGVSSSLSLIIGEAMLAPTPVAGDVDGAPFRTPREVVFGKTLSALWFAYPAVSLLRTLALMIGAGDDWGAESSLVQPTTSIRLYPRRALTVLCSTLSIMVRSTYLACVTSPVTKSTVAVTRLSGVADGIHWRQAEGESDQLLPMTDLFNAEFETSSRDLKMRMHVPEVSPLCSQGTDSVIALVDIFSQAFAALGCAFLTLGPE